MTNKTEAIYRHVFMYIAENIFDMNCKSFMTDYETSMRNALHFVYPEAQLFACWFHFCQACRKRVSMLKMMPDISAEDQLRRLYYKFLCIPLLPAEKIVEAFRLLSLEARAVDIHLFSEFLLYFENQWIKKVSSFFLFCFIKFRTDNLLIYFFVMIGRA